MLLGMFEHRQDVLYRNIGLKVMNRSKNISAAFAHILHALLNGAFYFHDTAAGQNMLGVHIGGPGRRLLPLLADAGVDGVEGIAGAPQSDASIKEAREAAGPNLTLWGGIPQDFLLKTYSEEQFETAVLEAARQAMEDSRAILGIADRVSVNSEFTRLKATASLITDAGSARA
jgi:hypothetical protein